MSIRLASLFSSWSRWSGLAAVLVVGWAGCRSAPGPRHAEEPPPPPPPPLAGSTLFYDGALECRLDVSFSGQRPHGGGGGGGGRGGRVSGGLQGNGGSRGANLGGGVNYDAGPANVGVGTNGGGGTLGVGMGGRGGGSRSRSHTSDDDEETPPIPLAAMGPPAALYLRFTNRGKTPIEFEVRDFASQFGNFAVQPDKFALAPGQWADAEPMSSQILNTTGNVAVKVSLRAADHNETETVLLVPVAPG